MEVLDELSKVFPVEEYENYGDLSYEEQTKLFLSFKKPFDELKLLSERLEEIRFLELLENAIILAVDGNPVAQDFLTFIYKKGRTNIMEPNLLRAYEWGIIASNSLSMLSIDRLKFFFNPAYETLANNEKLSLIIEKYDLTEQDIEYFFGANIANMMMSCSDISIERLSKEQVIPDEFLDEKIREMERIRDRVLENMIEILIKE